MTAASDRILSYVLSSDDGMAPNVAGGVCTLALCKPVVRHTARPGRDWVVGMSTTDHGENRLIYVMAVDTKISFTEFAAERMFKNKIPTAEAPWGDNAFIPDGAGRLVCNPCSPHANQPIKIARDLRTPFALISENFWYFGGNGPDVPKKLRDRSLVVGKAHFHAGRRGHRVTDDKRVILPFIQWLENFAPMGIHGTPRDMKSAAALGAWKCLVQAQ